MLQAVVRLPEELTAEEIATWRAVCAAVPDYGDPLLGHDFARLAALARPDARVAVLRRGRRIAGFLAHHRPRPGPALPIGTAFSDVHAIIAAPGEPIDGAEALRAAGLSGLRAHGLIDPGAAFPMARPVEGPAYVIAPDAGAALYYQDQRRANPKRFRNFGRLEHKLERTWGPLALEARETSPAVLDQLIAWKRRQLRRTGQHDVFRPAWSRALLHRALAGCGELRGVMMTLRAGGRLAAGHFGIAVGGRAHGWLSVIDPACAACGPGQILTFRTAGLLEAAGLESYGLGPGSDHFKAPFATGTVSLSEGLLGDAGWVGAALGLIDATGAEHGLMRRMARRLDLIDAAETSLAGRARGWFDAVAGTARRDAGNAVSTS
jgi:CelD/BcsL family acetyltransferase involved in cellulose biosynthesis